ncbi:ankyrin repeat domain-containing protein 66 isoform X2 [Cyrtonyx montezumae]|uniref:ankyrin repeat domain-containing protein 66 isoform X2 n=1 Tax=Cyrtonyx montezumae TaxID=9017 RepID=UPI0032DA3182
MTELHQAVASGHYERAEQLLRTGRCDPNHKDPDWGDWTPLHWAAANGHVAMLRLLLNRGARPCVRNAVGRTPVHCAAEAGRLPALRALHAGRAPMDAADPFGDTPRRLAEIYGHAECVGFLETAEVESRDYRRTAAMRGVPLDMVDEDWELKKEELERNLACARRGYTTHAQKKTQRKRRKQ